MKYKSICVRSANLIVFTASLLSICLPTCANVVGANVPVVPQQSVPIRGAMRSVKPLPIFQRSGAGTMDILTQGIVKYQKGDLHGALGDFSQAIYRDPDNVQAVIYRAVVREQLGDYINALADLEQNRVAPCQSVVLSEKGFCFAGLNDFKTALQNYDRSLSLDSTSDIAASTYARRSMVKRTLGDSDGALADCNKALELDPKNLDAYFQRAITYSATGKVPKAIDDLRIVLKGEPGFADAHMALAQCLAAIGDRKEAISEYKQAADLYAAAQDKENQKLALSEMETLQLSASATKK